MMSGDQNNGKLAEESAQVRRIAESVKADRIYSSSIRRMEGMEKSLFFLLKREKRKQLIVLADDNVRPSLGFDGETHTVDSTTFTLCDLSDSNAESLRRTFPFTRPELIGKVDSYGLGDRLGNAGPAHLRAVRDTGFRPVMAQQSIRELERTHREPHDVMNAASWAVFQEGYTDGFGADADHLKTSEDIDRMARAGYTMFTIDPSDHVREVSGMESGMLEKAFQDLPWQDLQDSASDLLDRYEGKAIALEGQRLNPGPREIREGMVKYGQVIAHTKKMSDHLKDNYPDRPGEIELSVDETNDPTTPFEHYLIASELHRLGVSLVSLAPRFCGDFEKGVDFRGDLDQFRKEYNLHLAIAREFGGYKMSIHSGSDKFSVYEVIGDLNKGAVHVKTAGTSYLEALRTVAQAAPKFFLEILDFSATRFEEDKKTYQISARLERIPGESDSARKEPARLLDQDDARQVLHVAYGSVLSGDQPEASDFRTRMMELLSDNEDLYEENLIRHFNRHLQPFG